MPRPQPSRKGGTQSPLDVYLRQIDETPLLTPDEEQEVASRIQEGDPEARDYMVRANLRLVVNIARGYVGRGLCMQDLIAEGNMGLMRAVEGFDPSRNIRFSTYASYWIKQSIRRGVVRMSKTVRLPDYMMKLVIDWRKTSLRLEGELGRKPSDDEVATRLNLRPKQVAAIKKAVCVFNAAAEGSASDEDTGLDDLISHAREAAPPAALSSKEDVREVLAMLDKLEPRAASVMRLRYGLEGGAPLTLQQIGDTLGLTRERARQIEREALRELYQMMVGAE